MKLLFRPDDSGTDRGTGYATVDYWSSAEDETLTFPDKAAADAASAAIRVGTVVYDRAGNSHYYVTE